MPTLAQRINQLLEPEVITDGDDSLLARALGGPTPYSETGLAYRRVEVLLSAWQELHREVATVRRLLADPDLGRRLQGIWIERALSGLYPGEDYPAETATCTNCGEPPHKHWPEDGYGFVCPTDPAPRADDERFTYTSSVVLLEGAPLPLPFRVRKT